MKSLQWTAAALLLGLGVSALFAQLQARRNEARIEAELQHVLDRYMTRVEDRVSIYQYGLQGARGVVAAVGFDELTRERFAAYARARHIETEFPGSMGFGVIRRVGEAQAPLFVTAARAEQRPGFDIHGLAPHPGDRYVIQYIEPERFNEAAIGLDIASEAARRRAAETAARTGSAQLTEPLTLVQATDRPGRGFLLLLAIYRDGLPLDTPEHRFAATSGWVYAPLLIDKLLQDLVSPTDSIVLQLRDDGAGSQASGPFFESTADHEASKLVPPRSASLDFYGRRWRLEVAAKDDFVRTLAHPSAPLVFALGCAVSVLSCALLYLKLSSAERIRRDREDQEALARGVINASPQAIVVTDAHGRVVRANRRMVDVFGYAPDAVIGQPIEMLIPTANREPHRLLRARYDGVERPMGSRGRLMGLHAKGHEFPIRVHLSPLQQGDEHLVIAGVLDVSVEFAALDQAKVNEARWRELANSMPQLVWTCQADGLCDFLSVQWVNYTGIPERDQLGYGWIQQVHPDDRENLQHRWQASVDTRSVFRVEFRIRRRDGVYRWFDTQAVPLLDCAGNLLRWVGSNTDIEDRVRAETTVRELNATLEGRIAERTAALEAARRDLRNILDAMPSMVGYWDADQRNRFANRAYGDWFGIDAEKIPGRHLSELIGPALYEKNRPFAEAALRGEPQIFEREITSPSGVSRFGLANYLPDVVDGTVRGFYVLVHDVTELRRAREAAEAANRAKSMFLANMSHEIRTPLNAVINLTYLLERTALAADQRELLSKVNIAGRALLGVINDILDLSKIEAGEMRVEQAPFDLPRIVHDATKLMSAAAEEKALVLDVRIETAVPVIVRGDGLRVSQMLSNLLANAIKFTERGRVSIAVTSEAEGVIRFSIEDTGIGIQPEVLERLFRPFTQGDASTTRRFGGTGLGLAIVRRLADLMGGTVGAESRPGAGSLFWFRLPLPADAADKSAGAQVHELDALIVDDDSERRRVLSVAARALGWRVETETGGMAGYQRALERAASGRAFDVLILDWKMQGLDGLALLGQLRDRGVCGEGPTLALMTAYDTAALRRLPESELADAILPTPVTTSQLLDVVQVAIRRRSATHARLLGYGSAPVAARPSRLTGARILLVDDSVINLEVGQRILEDEGARVTTAADGRAAIDRIASDPLAFDLVLMDVQMPVMDGIEATRYIRNELGLTALPIVALTAGAMVGEREHALSAGMTEFVSKPFDAESMIRMIGDRVRRRPGLGAASAAAQPSFVSRSDPWPRLEGIDANRARAMTGGDLRLFRSVVERLLAEYGDLDPAMLDRGDPAVVTALAGRAHKLAGASGAVGALLLHRDALALERACRDRLDEAIRPALEAVARGVSALGDACSRWIATIETTPSAVHVPTAEDIERLRRRLDRRGLDSLDLFRTLRPGLESVVEPHAMETLAEAIDQLDFSRAALVLADVAMAGTFRKNGGGSRTA